MRLTCPNCLTDYQVPDEAVAGRTRTLRCAYCGHQWRHNGGADDGPAEAEAVRPLEPAAEVEDEPAVAEAGSGSEPLIDVPPLLPEPAGEAGGGPLWVRQQAVATPGGKARPMAAPRRVSRAPAAIVLLAVLLVAVAIAAHAPIMQAWPASARFYQALGIK